MKQIIIQCRDGVRYRTDLYESQIDGIYIYMGEKWQVEPETRRVIETVKPIEKILVPWNRVEKIVGGE